MGESRTGSIIKQDGQLDEGVRLVQIKSDDCGLSNLTLDGNAESQSIVDNKQRHGIFVVSTNRLLVENVTSQNFAGDGFYIGSNVSQVTFSNVLATLNKRHGIALAGSGNISDIKIINSTVVGNAAQQIDSEPKKSTVPNLFPQVNNVTISGCIIDPDNSNDYAITCSGDGEKDNNRSRGWTLTGNIIKGSVRLVWCDDVCITGNVIDNCTTKPCVDIYRTTNNIVVTGNRLKYSQTIDSSTKLAAVSVIGKKEGENPDVPSSIVVADNNIEVVNIGPYGIRAEGTESVTISGNQVNGGPIGIRATTNSTVFRSAIVSGNKISNTRQDAAIFCSGDTVGSGGKFLAVDISHNTIIDEGSSTPIKYGIDFSTNKPNQDAQITLIGNQIRGQAQPIRFPSTQQIFLTGGNRGAGGIYSLKGNPQGIIMNEIVGAIALNRDDGKFYVFQKTGNGNAWVEK